MSDFKINTVYYENVHGGVPAWNKKNTWVFQPPRRYGYKPHQIEDVTYKKAASELEKYATRGGEWILLP